MFECAEWVGGGILILRYLYLHLSECVMAKRLIGCLVVWLNDWLYDYKIAAARAGTDTTASPYTDPHTFITWANERFLEPFVSMADTYCSLFEDTCSERCVDILMVGLCNLHGSIPLSLIPSHPLSRFLSLTGLNFPTFCSTSTPLSFAKRAEHCAFPLYFLQLCFASCSRSHVT